MSEEQTNEDAQTGDTEQTGRPGGPPERTLANERVEALEKQVRDLSEAIKAGNAQAADLKGSKNNVEQEVELLKQQQAAYARDLQLAKIETAAAKIGAKDPDLIAQLVAGEENSLAAIDRLKTEKPYLFGAPPRPAGADMNGGSGTGGNGMDDLDKHIAERFGGKV